MSEANAVAAVSPGGPDATGDVQQPQQQAITVDNCPHMSIDDLLKIIKGANGMPVLFIPSSDDGQFAAIAVDGLRNLDLAPPSIRSMEKKQEDFRAWVLLLTSLAATITFTAGLTPPGGFWAADDKANGYVAGASVMCDKFPVRCRLFHLSNTAAFFSSLMIIGMLAKNIYHREPITMMNRALLVLVGVCFASLGISYITGAWSGYIGGVYASVAFGAIVFYMMATKH